MSESSVLGAPSHCDIKKAVYNRVLIAGEHKEPNRMGFPCSIIPMHCHWQLQNILFLFPASPQFLSSLCESLAWHCSWQQLSRRKGAWKGVLLLFRKQRAGNNWKSLLGAGGGSDGSLKSLPASDILWLYKMEKDVMERMEAHKIVWIGRSMF